MVKFEGEFPRNSSQSYEMSTANAIFHKTEPTENHAINIRAAMAAHNTAHEMERQIKTRQQICLPVSLERRTFSEAGMSSSMEMEGLI